MEKVKLSVAEANDLETAIREGGFEWLIKGMMKMEYTESYSSMKDIDTLKLTKALLLGYEVVS